ncbi:MAG: hypothetical protein OWQ48_02845 [Desulfurococcus sp.]|nr:hypothetical protein [Desulfurococcus sp.]
MKVEKYSLKDIALSAVEAYNKVRSPEATARLVDVRDDEGLAVIEFQGSFCLTCGVRDWVEDYKYVLISMGYEAELIDYLEPEGEEYKRVGVFKVKSV